jgi:hypothetical protein
MKYKTMKIMMIIRHSMKSQFSHLNEVKAEKLITEIENFDIDKVNKILLHDKIKELTILTDKIFLQ